MNIIAEKNRFFGEKGWEASNLPLFGQVATYPNHWLSSAAEHLYAAEVILPRVNEYQIAIDQAIETKSSISLPPSLTSIFLFHCALSVENTIKSLISATFQEEIISHIESTSKIPKILLGHNLKELASRVDLPLNINQEFALVFLTRYGVWNGKYHQPTKHCESNMTEQLSDGNHYLTGGYNPESIPSYFEFSLDFYKQTREKINKLSK